MSDYSPLGALEHVSRSGRATKPTSDAHAVGAAGDAAAMFAADDAAFTRPLPILAERRLGDSGISAFPFALGTARLAAIDDVAAERVLHRFATRGGSLYDISDEDGSGRSQELVARWLDVARPPKIMTVLTPAVERDGGRVSGPPRLVRAVEAALGRLRREQIDLMLIDLSEGARLGLTIDELLAAAEELVLAGKVRHVGAAAASGGELLQARVLAGDGLPRIVALRIEWDITDKAVDQAELRMVAAAQQLALLPDATSASLALASPSLPAKVLAGWGRNGRLGQAMNARLVKPERDRATDVLSGRGREHRIGVALDHVSAELDVPPAATQIAWLLAKRGVVAPIVRVTRPEQVDVLMDAASVRLTRAQMLELDRAVEMIR